MLECLHQLGQSARLRHLRRLLQLLVLLKKPVVKLRQLHLHVILDVLLLRAHNLEDLVAEFKLTRFANLFKFVKQGAHEWW